MVPFLLLAVVKLVTCPRHQRKKRNERKKEKEEKDELHIAVQGFSISQIHFKSVCRARWSAMITQTKAGGRGGGAAEAGEAA